MTCFLSLISVWGCSLISPFAQKMEKYLKYW